MYPRTYRSFLNTTHKQISSYGIDMLLYIRHPIASPIPYTPAFPLAFSLDLHDDIHVLLAEILHGSFAHVFEIGTARGDDVDHAEGFCLGVAVAVVVVMVVVMMMMVMIVIVIVIMRRRRRMRMVNVAMGMTVSVAMVMSMVMSRRRRSIVEPELGNRVSNHTPQRTDSSEGVPQIVLHICRQRE